MTEFDSAIRLRAVGFCGADDSVAPELLELISSRYPWVEWGILFRSDLEGQPRYPTSQWVERLSQAHKRSPGTMLLAGHLCADRCQAILEGDHTFVKKLKELGFGRVQVNATAANSVVVNSERLNEYVANIRQCMENVPKVEWIIQCNDETKPLWERLVVNPPSNMSILYDASCGKGVRVTNFPSPAVFPSMPCGYAGGIGPDCIREILAAVKDVTSDTSIATALATTTTSQQGQVPPSLRDEKCSKVWIDMESSLRVKVVPAAEGVKGSTDVEVDDVFSIDKCFECIIAATEFGLPLSS